MFGFVCPVVVENGLSDSADETHFQTSRFLSKLSYPIPNSGREIETQPTDRKRNP